MPPRSHICFTFIGDINFDSRLLKCARTLSSNGYQVSAIIAGEKRETREESGITVIKISVSSRSTAKRRFFSFYLKALLPSIRIRAQCYFASDLYSLPLAFIAAKICRAKLLYDSRELYSSIAALQKRRIAQRFWSAIERRIIPSVDAIFTVNDSLAEILSKQFQVSKPIILLNCPPKEEIRKSDRLRNLLSLPRGQKIILYQGGLQRGRGLFRSLSVMKKFHDAFLVILGAGNLKNKILRAIEDQNLRGRVFLLEAVPVRDLLHYTASADLGLCLIENYGVSYYYSLPNKIFEYMAAGIPVVASNFPEITRFVNSNRVGLTVDPENEEEIVNAIGRILSDADFISTLVKNCKETAKRYNWENEESKLISTVENLNLERDR